jgi:hypothetical protein
VVHRERRRKEGSKEGEKEQEKACGRNWDINRRHSWDNAETSGEI